MTGTEEHNALALPKELRAQFARLEKRLWQVETRTALYRAASVLGASFLVLYISDRFWETPVSVRVVCAGAGWAGVAGCAAGWVKNWVVRRRSQRGLAILVQREYRRLGDRLLGVVELADEAQRPAHFSPALYQAAIQQVATEAQQYDFAAVVKRAPENRARTMFLAALGVMAVASFLSAPVTLNGAERWFAPWAQIPRVTLVQLRGLPDQLIVPHGEPFELRWTVGYLSWWKPTSGRVQFERQPRIRVSVQDQQGYAKMAGQVGKGTVKIRLGDAEGQIVVVPTHRPSLTMLMADNQLPGYLRLPATTEAVANGTLNVLEGSRVTLRGQVSRGLVAAEMRLANENTARPMTTLGDRFASEPLALEEVPEVALSWRDEAGLSNAAPWRLQIHAVKDSPATPELVDLLRDTAILETEVLDIRAAARDDFGVRELRLEWQLVSDVGPTNSSGISPFTREAPSPHEKRLEEVFHFSPSLLGLPPDSIVELRGAAVDFFPDREPSRTPVYRVHVMGNERHAELVRQNLESLLSRLEEVTRLEEKLAQSTRELQAQSKEQLQSDAAAERIAAAKDDQAQNAAHLDQLAREGKKTLREATRNPTFADQDLREWAENLREMQSLSQEKMSEASQALKEAQQNPENRAENLAAASNKEQEILDALEELQRKVNKGLDQLQAMTLAQRLRKLSSDEKGIAKRLRKIVPETIGLLPKELPDRFRSVESTLSGEQGNVQKDTTVLQGELGRFFERTQKDAYGQVNKEMSDSRIGDELDRLRGLISENIAMESIQDLGIWSDRLTAWADLLEPKSASGGGGGGGGGGEGDQGDEALMKVLLGLLRTRDREVNLRQRTGLLDRQKSDPAYVEKAKGLAETQTAVQEEVRGIQGENPVPALEFPLQDIIDSMGGVQELLNKPQTDRDVDMAQTKSIDLLSDVINLINEQQQKNNSASSSSSQSPSAEEMAFLMQMLSLQNSASPGMGVNPRGGANQSGGTTDRAATPVQGDPNARPGEARSVSRASGSSVTAPTEFREALENYYRALENLERKP